MHCPRMCYQECVACKEACKWRCAHYQCSMRCSDICDRPVCNEPCTKQLRCGHPCIGLCGEKCPDCRVCKGTTECTISLKTLAEFEPDERAYVLPECGHHFMVEMLDQYFEVGASNEGHQSIKLPSCPTCRRTVYTAGRYNQYIKRQMKLLNEVKKKMNAQLTKEELDGVVNAMRIEGHNAGAGHWFACPNGHPYFIGECGGAMQLSRCPECDAPIGGGQHQVVQGNRFLNIDGAAAPAWPPALDHIV
eukprot:TRINITY_DN58_c0_g1::TRINITY_DN58_c0_g1_i1::g.14803::m.14803 TRINITY_DN58_c0_g1::TRINITY_DN58_c0_g1_i1::g.14803  ORF type:complete len:248 (+),score=34.89,sp/Q8R151/ZNFX1_MOUSE/39.55/5e-29,sp/Q8R151/ZNFX1_MOUSE/44.90/3e-15,sp/Q8R151/ZNFX1_MOUSE/43.37/2e-07,zf-RING_2/PF13639.1/1.5e+04,zf-RING_2/PF13639.1/1e-06,zf-RING_2/PF13639.1/1.5e+03 TRINITY_DN58_c0_g1_i1:1033-1776(+)